MGDLTTVSFARGTLSLKVPHDNASFAAFQVRGISVETSIEVAKALVPQVSAYPIGAKINAKSIKISAMLVDVTAADLALAFSASESSGTITLDDSLIFVGAQLVIPLNANGALATLTLTIPYALIDSNGSIDFEADVHEYPLSMEGFKKDASTAVATIVVAAGE